MFARATLGSPATAVKVTGILTTAAASSVPLWGVGAAAGPIGAGIAVAGALISALIANSGCGPTCVLATRIVDQLEPQLKANRDAFLAGSHTAADQAAALANFDAAWSWLSSAQACGSPELGDAGRRCISDRNRGGQWDWFSYYRDPIASTPVQADAISQTAANLLPGGSNTVLLLAAAALFLGVLL
jgi:hypothetical protein